jgi:hypothetical protein
VTWREIWFRPWVKGLIESLAEYEECPEEGDIKAGEQEDGDGDGEQSEAAEMAGAKMRAAEHRAAVDEWQLREDERSALLAGAYTRPLCGST